MDLMLSLKNVSESGLQWCGTSNKLVGKLAPNTCTELALTLLATKPGLQVVFVLFLKRTSLNISDSKTLFLNIK